MASPHPDEKHLASQIDHIFLPPKLLRKESLDGIALLKTTRDELSRFRTYFDASGGPKIDRCIRMLDCMTKRFQYGEPSEMDAFAREVAHLENNGFLVLYIEDQRAALLITRKGAEMRFELLELPTPDKAVTNYEGRIRRSFPTRAATISRSLVLGAPFRQSFFQVLDVLDKGKWDRWEPKHDPRHHRMLAGMVMAVLGGVGHCVMHEVPRIQKHSREEVVSVWVKKDEKVDDQDTDCCLPTENTTQHRGEPSPRRRPRITWCRSPLWFLVKVVLQLKLDHGEDAAKGGGQPHYKAFMLFFLSSMLQKAALAAAMPHELLCFMNAKIKRRALKLGTAHAESWYSFPSEVSRRVDATLAEHWAATQSPGKQELHLPSLATLDLEQDTVLSLETLRPYLAWVSARNEACSRNEGIGGFSFRRTGQDEAPRGAFSNDRDIAFFELADFERWVERDAERFLSPNRGSQARTGRTATRSPIRGERVTRDVDAGLKARSATSSPVPTSRGRGQSDVPPRDDSFARDVWATIGTISPGDKDQETVSRLCDECLVLPVLEDGFELFVNPVRLGSKSARCDLCAKLYRALWPAGTALPVWPVRLYREGTNLMTEGHDRPVLRMCVGPEWQGESRITVGQPRLPDRPSAAHFELIVKWLQECDRDHKCWGYHVGSEALPQMPSRILDVGDGEDPHVQLVCTDGCMRGRYAALSHRWGEQTDEYRRRNCTLPSNIAARCRGIDSATLGRTFQDAITVTRGLGLRYLWIDSLCIIQGDSEDWKQESRRMEDVFASAYCVIAATAAEGTNAGFLLRSTMSRGFAAVPVPSADGTVAPLYFCDPVDDFAGDVENADLNRRGWVLQERALARRTIHFSASQTYMECGYGIRCESLNLLESANPSSLSDAQFPKRALETRKAHEVFQPIFKAYSRLELTQAADRPVAIAGIERRLASTLHCPVAFGILGSVDHLHRSLLWRRAGRGLLTRIAPSSQPVPTWSWTAFKGAIDYLDIAEDRSERSFVTAWNFDISFCLLEDGGPAGLSAPVMEFDTETIMGDSSCLVLDCQRTANVRTLRCVVVARSYPTYHIIVVAPKHTGEPCSEYERVGIASVERRYIAMERGGARVRLV